MKILIINPFGIGDVLFTTPLISALHQRYPEGKIAYVANRRALPAIESNPKIYKTYIYERDEFKDELVSSWTGLFKDIRKEGFDIAIDFSLNASFSFFCLAAGIKRRIGYDYRGRGFLLTDKLVLKGYEGRHVTDYYLDLLRFIDPVIPLEGFKLEIGLDDASRNWAQAWLKERQLDGGAPLIAVIPGGGASWGKDAAQKRWPVSKYALLVDKIVAKSKAAIILMGDQKEQPLCRELARLSHSPVHDAVGQTNLLQMAALLERCAFAVVNDGGPLHVAVAAGTRTVSIFGPVDPRVYGPYPYGERHLIVQKGLACQPCYRRFRKAACAHLSCLHELSVEDVVKQIERVL